MVSGTGPNRVRLTGENNYMRLHSEENGPMTTRASHWRVLLSPSGPGHVLFLKSDVTDDQVRIYSDNIAMTRWLQDEILGAGEFRDQALLVISAVFSRVGEASSFHAPADPLHVCANVEAHAVSVANGCGDAPPLMPRPRYGYPPPGQPL